MQFTDLLFTAIVGAIIGYFTNWLAIKMLFRPHHEKRIFGIKVPFTPGLIPKEQGRIANSVADAVATHLLTSDTMTEAMRNNGIDKKLKTWIESKASELSERKISIGEQIKSVVGEKFHDLINFIKDKLTIFIISFMKKEKFKGEAEDLIVSFIRKELSKNTALLLDSDFYKNIKNNLIKASKEYKSSEEFKAYIEKLIEIKILELENTNKSLGEVMPAGFISTIKVYVYSKNYDIAMAIKGMLKDEKIQFKLKKALGEMISSNVNSMVAMFLNPDTIYNKLYPAIEGYLDNEENQREIALTINEVIDKILNSKIKEITSNISVESKERNVKAISELITNKIIDDSLVDDAIAMLENKIRGKETFEELLSEFNMNHEEAIKRFVRDRIDGITASKEVEYKVKEYTDTVVDNTLNLTIGELADGKEEKISNAASKLSEVLFNRFLTTKAADFVEALNIRKIVEDKINSFDINFTEKLILEIASKELSAITWLGALLGFVMGLLSSIIAAI